MQLDLFSGDHVPTICARNALERGDLDAACVAFSRVAEDSSPAGRAAKWLGRLAAALAQRDEDAGAPAAAEHRAFAAASADDEEIIERVIGRALWFRLYAGRLGAALARAPAQRFRGWCRVHYELAAGRRGGALDEGEALVAAEASGFAWLERARVEFALGDDARARRFVLAACLVATADLDPRPPALAACEAKSLEMPRDVLPRLPPAIEAIWGDALDLDLPGAASRWVPCIRLLGGAFTPAQVASPELRAATGFDVRAAAAHEDPAREFLCALFAAREAHLHERGSSASCGPRELEMRRRMQRIAPPLFGRYMEELGLFAAEV